MTKQVMLELVMDDDHCYRVAASRDGRFDGVFFIAVTTTGIYCRPSCPAVTPKRPNVRFYPTAAAAQDAGFRACKRCRPDAAPGSPEWMGRADLVARAVRLIGDGVVEREGVSGLARRLGYGSRHLHRLVFAELGTGPLRLAKAHRVQQARMLLETTDLPISDVAYAAGFGSIRQFNDSVRAVYALSPSQIRSTDRSAGSIRESTGEGARAPWAGPGGKPIEVHLSYRPPLDLDGLIEFLGRRAVPGVEAYDGTTYSRVMSLPRGTGTLTLKRLRAPSKKTLDTKRSGGRISYVPCLLDLDDNRDFIAAVSRIRRLLDLDADPAAVDTTLEEDPHMRPVVAARRGARIPGAVDGAETAMRAVLGQQVSIASARRIAARLVDDFGKPLERPRGALTHTFPTPQAIAAADLRALHVPVSRAEALQDLSRAVAEGRIDLDPGADRDETEHLLKEIRGVGPWTASYVRMRALGDPDVFIASDLGIRRALGRVVGSPAGIDPESWRPWRSYATVYLWSAGEMQGKETP